MSSDKVEDWAKEAESEASNRAAGDASQAEPKPVPPPDSPAKSGN